MKIEIKILNKDFYRDYENEINFSEHEFSLPSYATAGSAALDLVCTKDLTIYPGETVMIPTGLAIWIGSDSTYSLDYHTLAYDGLPHGYLKESIGIAGLILPRSGLGTKGLVLANTIGLIDEDYQGELKISAWNRTNETPWKFGHIIDLRARDRIAQLMFIPVIKAQWDVVEEFSNTTERGENGYGSTGA